MLGASRAVSVEECGCVNVIRRIMTMILSMILSLIHWEFDEKMLGALTCVLVCL